MWLTQRMRFGFDIQSILEIQIEGFPIETFANKKLPLKNTLQLPWVPQELYLSTPELIEKDGYPVETHSVTTEDGYVLTLHRIPRGKNHVTSQDPLGGRPVALLQQGTFCSSAVWVMHSGTPEKALAYRLVDHGYDVWLANYRGSTYSKKHVCLSNKSKEFWDFSWHQMGKYDIPANFDYILNLTGQPDLYYIGHSMGTTSFFVGMALHPEYNAKVRLMVALAPVAFTENVTTPVHFLSHFLPELEWLGNRLNVHQILPQNGLMDFLGATVCHQLSPIKNILPTILNLLCGFDNEQLNKDLMPIMLGHVPAGTSRKSLMHYGQGVNSGEFRCYDYGKEQNEINYGQSTPPHYDLAKVTAPVALYYGKNDWLSSLPDVHRLADLLPNVVVKYGVPFDKFNHMDFLWSIDVRTLLYDKLENDMFLFQSNLECLV